MNVYVTTFDSGYLSRAVVLAESFARHCPEEVLYLCCMDDLSYRIMSELALPGTVIVPHERFAPPELARLRAERSVGEYCWTSKPYILEYILGEMPIAAWAVYLDTDMMVFGDLSSPQRAEANLDCLFTPHAFSPAFAEYSATVGRFNAGYVAFRNDGRGREALAEWKRLCTESCSAVPVESGYGDQRYLDDLATHWRCEPAAPCVGLNAAPWNIDNYAITIAGGSVLLDGQQLRLFHFQGLRILSRHAIDLYGGPYRLPDEARRFIYVPYARRLARAEVLLVDLFPSLARRRGRGSDLGSVIRAALRGLRGVGNPYFCWPTGRMADSG